MTGQQNGQAASTTGAACAVPAWRLASPCRCWSCNSQCGGTNHPDSCGPAADLDGRPACQACRAAADVIDTERAGAKVTIDQDRIRLRADVWNPYASSLWMDARTARHLSAVLADRAAELDRQTAATDAELFPWVKTCDHPGCVMTGQHSHGTAPAAFAVLPDHGEK